MFTDQRFKVKCELCQFIECVRLMRWVWPPTDGVDKRGRRVHESSAEDLRRYYHLHDNDGKHVTSPRTRLEKLKKKRLKVVTKSDASDVSGAENEKSAVGGHTHHPDESESDGESVSSEDDEVESDSSTDVEEVIALKEPEVGVVSGYGLNDKLTPDSAQLVGRGCVSIPFHQDWFQTGSVQNGLGPHKCH